MLIAVIVMQLASFGSLSDIDSFSVWVGLFALAGWTIIVLPLVARFGRARIFIDPRWSWMVWSALAVVAFFLLCGPMMGRDAFLIAWYPALMGCIAGPVFSMLSRSRRKNA
jgi:hypothetical protein